MDGNGHDRAHLDWREGSDEAPRAAMTFDPSAVLRAIEDEDDGDVAPTPSAAAVTPDLNEALRAAMSYEGVQDHDLDGDEPDGEWTETDEDAPDLTDPDEDDVAAAWRGEVEADEVHETPGDEDGEEELSAIADGEDDAEEWTESGEDEDVFQAAPAPLRAMDDPDRPDRKPRIALMGEFSAGKSTLSNLLIGAAPLPTKVTATQLPPVWISWGDAEAYREDLDGRTHPVDLTRLSEIDPSETCVVRIFQKSEILKRCDIIDMPGISDPNMASEVWERVIGKADGVIWCTHATQAWRQSEASVWESLDPALFDKSLLLVTRFDKITSETDRVRVMKRVTRETEGLFTDRLPISLTEALAAGEDPDLWDKSGAAAFMECLTTILDRLADETGIGQSADPAARRISETLRAEPVSSGSPVVRTARPVTPSRILPRRIRPVSDAIHPNAEAETRDHAV